MKEKPYKIPQLPYGWYIEDVSFRLVDAASIVDDDGTQETHIKVAFEDNGSGHYLKLNTVNGKDEILSTFEIDADSLRDISNFCDAFVTILDKSQKRAFNETDGIWKRNCAERPDGVEFNE